MIFNDYDYNVVPLSSAEALQQYRRKPREKKKAERGSAPLALRSSMLDIEQGASAEESDVVLFQTPTCDLERQPSTFK